ncbi:RNA polymerase sigma factor [Tundrisphaera lichenicola]|uniref:RNA polymerase sigma factor n=1 Tax=Tundrisphaera lichenicola TaxID=2029860 RepID=UPI003EB98CBB
MTRFQTTRWTMILAARDGGGDGSDAALAELCEAYWYPLYAFLRRKGHGAEAAEDLVQGFFARLLEKGDLSGVVPERGRFRSFLMAACSHYAANRLDHDRAEKRGGGRSPISIDRCKARGRYDREPSHTLTAERLFERRWALTVLDLVLARLEAEMAVSGKADLLEALRPALLGSADRMRYAEVSEVLGLSEVAARAAAGRLRRRYRALLREEVGRTLDDPSEVEGEIRELLKALAD